MISDLVDGGVAKSVLDASADDIADVVVLIAVVVAVADAVDAGPQVEVASAVALADLANDPNAGCRCCRRCCGAKCCSFNYIMLLPMPVVPP
jgi:hypothetical protein